MLLCCTVITSVLASPHLLGTRVFSVLSPSCFFVWQHNSSLLKCKSVEVGKDSFQPACFKHRNHQQLFIWILQSELNMQISYWSRQTLSRRIPGQRRCCCFGPCGFFPFWWRRGVLEMGGRSRIKYPYSCWGEFLLSLGHTLDKQIFWFLMFMTFQLFFM